MRQTSAEFHKLELSCATSYGLIAGLHPHLIIDDDHIMRLKSYILLCHAAFEEYLEKISLFVLQQSFHRFRQNQVIPKALLAASTYYSNPMQTDLRLFRNSDDFWVVCDKIFHWSVECHKAALADIHGIKTKHQDKVFLPVGIRIHDFDHLLSQCLNAFGEGRGKVAHEFRIEHRLPRAACEQNVRQLINLLLPFDQEMNRICDQNMQI